MATTRKSHKKGSRLAGISLVSTGASAAPRGPWVRPGSAAADRLDNVKVQALTYGLLAAAGSLAVGGVLLAKNALRKGKEERQHDQASQESATYGSAANLAERIHISLNPSGFESLRAFDGTDYEAVFNVARVVPTQAALVQVGIAYRALTTRQLSDDLREELSTSEFNTFWNIIGKKPLK